MKMSTVNVIHWVAIAGFWVLVIGDLITPGQAPGPLKLIEQVCVYVFLSASFYTMGASRSAKKTTTTKEAA